MSGILVFTCRRSTTVFENAESASKEWDQGQVQSSSKSTFNQGRRQAQISVGHQTRCDQGQHEALG